MLDVFGQPRSGHFGGLPITFAQHALEKTEERLFPASRHRSKRVHKKLVKRLGGEFVMQPCIFRTPHGIVAHPSFRAKIAAAAMEQANG